MATERVCIVGGGATGAALAWCLAQDEQARSETDVTLIHNQAALGGHSFTVSVKGKGGEDLPVDLGVQLIAPMVYANVALMLTIPEIAAEAPVTDYNELKIACAYPDLDGKPRNWANFPAYQGDPLFAMYTDEMRDDSEKFQMFLELALVEGWATRSVAEYFAKHGDHYGSPQQSSDWVHYFLWPYLSIINGYGAALMDQTMVGDLIPFFGLIPGYETPLGSFTQPGKGWQRFTHGASSWVQGMVKVAQTMQPSAVLLNSTVQSVVTPDSGDTRPRVTWKTGDDAPQTEVFDKVVLTTDMQTNAGILKDSPYWGPLYSKYIDPSIWALQPGMCFVHTDPNVLSPNLRNTGGQTGFEQETLQFTAYNAPQDKYPYYDLYKTYTTYLQANLLDTPDAAGIYNTMYGYIPQPGVDVMPDPDSLLFPPVQWIHSKFAPSFAVGAKKNLYKAQSPGQTISYPEQAPTNEYFAGNNTTYDSEDGALEAAMIIANYAFGVEYPFFGVRHHAVTETIGVALYELYFSLMFPGKSPSHPWAHLFSTAGSALRHAFDKGH